MASANTRYPIIVDTDTLITVANSSLWTQITEHVGLTTNVCKQELERHVENTHETTPEGSRLSRLHHGFGLMTMIFWTITWFCDEHL